MKKNKLLLLAFSTMYQTHAMQMQSTDVQYQAGATAEHTPPHQEPKIEMAPYDQPKVHILTKIDGKRIEIPAQLVLKLHTLREFTQDFRQADSIIEMEIPLPILRMHKLFWRQNSPHRSHSRAKSMYSMPTSTLLQ